MLSETSPLPKRTVRITWIITVLAFIYYVVLITRGTLDLFGQEVLGLVFNNMYTNLLHGNFDIDPDVLRYKNVFEAMVKDGKTYMYFGVFPSFLRGLFAPFVDLSVTYISRISVLLGLFLSVYFQVKAMLRLLGALNSDPFINWLYYLLLMGLLFGSPLIFIAVNASVYHEPIIKKLMMKLPGIQRNSTGRFFILKEVSVRYPIV